MLNRLTSARPVVLALLAAVTIGPLVRLQPAPALAGAWTMVDYRGPAAHGSATGQLLFVDGHFSLTYTMDEGSERWGRAHAGTYEINGDRLIDNVGWSMEYVAGKPSVARKPSVRETTFSLTADTLTVRFSNGSVQTFKRASNLQSLARGR